MRASSVWRSVEEEKLGKKEKTRGGEGGESVERAVGHIIKGIRLSEYFRDTIKRLLYGDRELSVLFVSSRYFSLRLPHPLARAVVPGAEPESRKLGCILIPVPAIFDPP